MRRDIRNFLKKVCGRHIHVDDNDSLLENGIIDSLTMIELLTFIERRFGVTVKDDELIPENFETIDAISCFLKQKLNSLH